MKEIKLAERERVAERGIEERKVNYLALNYKMTKKSYYRFSIIIMK